MFQQSQNEEYLQVCIDRVKNIELVWVEQFLDVISDNIDTAKQLRLNDIGCNFPINFHGCKPVGVSGSYGIFSRKV